MVKALVELHNIPPSAVKEADVDEHLRGEIHAKFLPSQRIRTRLAYISETLAVSFSCHSWKERRGEGARGECYVLL